jgi:hypothetical protein
MLTSRGSRRALGLASVLVTVCAARARAAGPLDNALPADAVDPGATAEWVAGHEASRRDFLDALNKTRFPNQATWFLLTAGGHLGHSGIAFGGADQPGPRHLRVGFTRAVALGSVVVFGNVDRVAALRSDAPYPGALGDDGPWLEAQRQSGRGLSLWVLPPGTSTRALRFSYSPASGAPADPGRLFGATLLAGRLANVAPEALVLASGHADRTARLVDGEYNVWDGWDNDAAARATPVSAARPEWVMLLWNEPVPLRGLGVLSPGFGSTVVEAYVGPTTVHPREASDRLWRPLASTPLPQRYPESFVSSWIDFGRPVTTRALRVLLTSPVRETESHLVGKTTDGRRGWLGELLALRALDAAPVPAPAPAPPPPGARPPPIAVPFTMPEAGYATLVIEDAQGRRVRNLVSDTWFPAGPQAAAWDGLDESGRIDGPNAGIYTVLGAPVAPGAYGVRGLFHGPIALSYELSVNSPGAPPWSTAPSPWRPASGGWLADHTSPRAALFLPGPRPRLLLASPVSEGNDAVIWTDLAGHKLDGRRWLGGAWTGASHLARDAGPRAVAGTSAYAGVAWEGHLRLTAVRDDGAFPPVVPAPAPETAATSLGGLAAWNGLLVAALPDENAVVFIDAATGQTRGRAPLPDGRGLAFDAEGRLLALSGRRLLAFARPEPPALGEARVLVDAGLEDPNALTVDAAGDIYVADRGASHQVKVFDARGRPRRTIGLPGGARVGPYDPRHMDRPAGLAVASDGHLWVAEDSTTPRRVSVWTTAGAFVEAFYGPPQYGGGGALDPRDRARFYYAAQDKQSTLEFALDWKSGTSTPRAILWLGGAEATDPPGKTGPGTPVYVGDRLYLTDVFNSRPVGGSFNGNLWLVRGARAVRVASLGVAGAWPLLATPPFRARWPEGVDPAKPSEPMIYAWSDLDGDGRASPEEVTLARGRIGSLTLNERLELCTAGAMVFAPEGFTPGGAPRYDARHGRARAGSFYLDSVSSGSGQVLALRDGWTFSSGGPVRGFHDGAPLWTYPNEWPSQQAGVWSTAPTREGELMATARVLSQTITPRGSDVGELVALNGVKGNIFLLSADGLFVSTLFHDGRLGAPAWSLPLATRGARLDALTLGEEDFWTDVSQTSDGAVYLVAGSGHSSVVRVDGLETARRLKAPPVTVTPRMLELASAWRAEVEGERRRRVGRDLLTVELRRAPVSVDGRLDEWADADWATIDAPEGPRAQREGRIEAAMAIAGRRLYVAYRSKLHDLLVNAGESGPLLFATGGALDVMLATDPKADPRRERPALGDLRLVVTRVGAAKRATLYRPKTASPRRPVPFSSPWRTVTLDEVTDVTDVVELAERDGAFELSIPLATLGLRPRDGLELGGDLGVLRGDGRRTQRRLYWQNKAASTVSDLPTEATLTPRLWGRLRLAARPR